MPNRRNRHNPVKQIQVYNAEDVNRFVQLCLDGADREQLDPIPVGTDVGIDVPELDTLSNILQAFHDVFGDIEWTDEDKAKKQVAELPDIVSKDEAYQNAMQHSDAQNARAESDRAANKAILATMSSGIELYKAVRANESFRKWIMEMVFIATYNPLLAGKRKTCYNALRDRPARDLEGCRRSRHLRKDRCVKWQEMKQVSL